MRLDGMVDRRLSELDAYGHYPPTAGEVQRQLEVLVGSPSLRNSSQLCRFLRYVVDRTLAGDTGGLKENLLGTEVFQRGIRYDPRTDPVVRVEARRLRAKLEEYYGNGGAETSVVIRIPKGSYIPEFERRTPVPSFSPTSVATPVSANRSVAVLPFVSVGADAETDYFADGLTDEVINLLGKTPGINVVARSSVYQFKGRTGDARELGQLLNATHLVEGSVRRHGGRLRIATQLVAAADGYQSWAQTFERDWTQIFTTQAEIAAAIAANLEHRASAPPQRSFLYTENLDAYNAVLKGRFHWNKRTVPGFKAAIEAYNEAIALAPDYAAAWAGLADCHCLLGFLNASSPDEARVRSREAAERALSLNDRLPAAHIAMAQQLAIYEWDWEGAVAALNRALELDDRSADAHYALSKSLAALGRLESALSHMIRAQQLDPMSLIIRVSLAWELAMLRRYEESDRGFQAAREFDPYFIWTYSLQAWSYEARGMMDEAISSLRQALGWNPGISILQGELAHALGKAGRRDEAQQILTELLERSREQYVSPFDLARAYEGLGARDLAMEAMQRACDERAPLLIFAGSDPLFDTFRADPRFQAILRRMHLVTT